MKKNRTHKALHSATRSARRQGTLPKQEAMAAKSPKAPRNSRKGGSRELLDIISELDLPPFTKDDAVSLLMESGHNRVMAEALANICWAEANRLTELAIAEMGI